MTYPDGKQVWYTYDDMNRMASATGLDGEVTTYTYDKAGRRIHTQTGNPADTGSLTTEYIYDSVGNLLEQATSGASSIAFRYSYNRNGYITGETRTEDGKTTENAYIYDPLGQLTSFTRSTGYGEQYVYDAAGNMLQKVITGEVIGSASTGSGTSPANPAAVTLKMQYNKANQLISMANGQDRIAYSYDKNGSMVKKVLTSKTYGKLTDTYTYNPLDQLTGYMGYDGYRNLTDRKSVV